MRLRLKWFWRILTYLVGSYVLIHPPSGGSSSTSSGYSSSGRGVNEDVYECQEPGCNRTFMSASGRRRHFQNHHQGIRKHYQYGCGKSYSAINNTNNLKHHERTCERNPDR